MNSDSQRMNVGCQIERDNADLTTSSKSDTVFTFMQRLRSFSNSSGSSVSIIIPVCSWQDDYDDADD